VQIPSIMPLESGFETVAQNMDPAGSCISRSRSSFRTTTVILRQSFSFGYRMHPQNQWQTMRAKIPRRFLSFWGQPIHYWG